LDIRKKSVTVKMVRNWKRMFRDLVMLWSLETFKARLDQALSNLIELWIFLFIAGSWTRWLSEVPSNSKDSTILLCDKMYLLHNGRNEEVNY